MTLSPGARLGPYEIVAPLGAGGMGEVYRAHDTRLNRDVAVKVLPAAVATDADRLRRFAQEARAAAALNHPNVIAVYDVNVEGDVPYVVSELLEGETLAAAIFNGGGLPQRTATDLAGQIALGLAAAHAAGIVHRDLKPANIFVTADGRAKILDFGLAKLIEPTDTAQGLTQLPAAPPTHPGHVLGTAGYMSPEQVRGEAVDHRTDIFAFGVVFYEMLSGQRAFTGDSAVEAMSAVLKQDPPALPPHEVPAALDRIVRRCLQKQPRQRFQSAGDIAYALEAIGASTTTAAAIAAPPPGSSWRWRALVAAALAGVVIGAVAARQLAPARAGVATFDARTFDRRPITNARFMPDGVTIVYSAGSRGYSPELFVINPNAEAPQPLGLNAHLLSVSTTGELALIVGPRYSDQRLYAGTLARMTLGSSPRPISENVREADWSPDGSAMAIVHDLGNGRDRLEFPAGTVLHEASGYVSNPRVSPDGQLVAFMEHQLRFDDRGWVKVVDRSGKVTTLAGEFFGLQGLAWLPDGSTVVFSGNTAGTSMLQPMSVPASGRAAAQPVLATPGRFIVLDVARDGRWLAVREDLSTGVRALVPSQETERDLSWLGSAGARGLSADGAWLLMVDVGLRGGRNYGVVLRKTDASQTIRLGEGSAQKLSLDGTWAAAIIQDPPQVVIYPIGAGEATRIDAAPIDRLISAEWFPDGRRLLVCGSEASRAPRCYSLERAGAPPTPVTPEGALATLAPDGRRLLLSIGDGRFQLATIDGGPPRPVQGLTSEDRHLAWSRDGEAVYVQKGLQVPARVERVSLSTGARSLARELTPQGLESVAAVYVTDWVNDGRWYAYNYTSLPSTLFVVTGAIQ